MTLRKLPVRVRWFGLLLLAGLAALFIFALARVAKISVTEQFLHREQILARGEASNIASFFQVFGNSVAVFAQLGSTKSRNANLVPNMDAFVEQWRSSGLVGGIVLIDTKGIVLYNSNVLGTSDVGANLSDRDYFGWAKGKPKEGEYFVGKPVVSRLGATKGQVIVPVASPVYQNGEFTGVVSTSVKLVPLTAHFLELMKISDKTDVYLFDGNGAIIYSSPGAEATGPGVFKLSEGDKIKSALTATGEAGLQTKSDLIAYSSIQLGSQNWLLAMSSPYQEVTSITTPIFIRLATVLLLVYLSILLFGEIISREIQKKAAK